MYVKIGVVELLRDTSLVWDTAVLGGGAAGLVAAISAASEGRKVVLFEKGEKLGKKILISGNGRCNITNRTADDVRHYHGAPPPFMQSVLNYLPLSQTLSFFSDLGIEVHEEKRGRLFPQSNQAQSVVDVLADRLQQLGVRICLDTEIKAVNKSSYFRLETTKGQVYQSERLIMASGGISAGKMGADGRGMEMAVDLGHEMTELKPGLVALESKEKYLRNMQGVKIVAEVEPDIPGKNRVIDCDDLLVTSYGVSGFTILSLSARVVPHLKNGPVNLRINLFPGNSSQTISVMLRERWKKNPHRSLEMSFTGLLNKKLVRSLLRHGAFDGEQVVGNIKNQTRNDIANLLTEWSIPVHKPREFEYAEVTIGGIKTSAINPESLESYVVPGLYFAGEMLEVYGDLGGFNFQWAWASGMLAGKTLGN